MHSGRSAAAGRHDIKHPLCTLCETDLEFVTRFVLASGSLKEIARLYAVSYPTIRGNLDRLIERLQSATKGRKTNPMAELLADLISEGSIATSHAKRIRKLHQDLMTQAQEQSS